MALIDSTKVSIQAGDDADEAIWFNLSYRLVKLEKEQLDDGYIETRQFELKLYNEQETLTSIVERKLKSTESSSAVEYNIVSNNGLAFDHAKIIGYAIERLRGKVEYTDIALHLMPKLFTLT
ncbi:hypothetical protein D3C81_1969060 [compost metagenome]